MSKGIPEGWTEDLLINLVTAKRGSEPGYETYCGPEEGVRFLRVGDLSGKTDNPVFTKTSGLLCISPDDILFALDGSPGLVAKGYSGAISSGIRLIKPKNQKIKKDFLFYTLQSPKVQSIVKAYTTGSTILHAGRSLQFIKIPIPPLSEQQKIASILSSVDITIEKTKAVIEQTKVVKKGLMQELLTRGLPGRHKKFKKTIIGEIPEEWEVVNLEQLGDKKRPVVRTGPFGSSMKTEHFIDRGVPVITIKSLGEGQLIKSGLFFVSEKKSKELSEYKVQAGDIVFSRVADVGRSVVIPEESVGWLISPNLMRICLDKRRIKSHFMLYSITGSPFLLKHIEEITADGGRQVVTSHILKGLKFPLPKLDEQKKILFLLNAMGLNIIETERVLDQIYVTKSALLQVLLTGEVGVKV